MQALVLVGGRGVRLRPLTESLPKPVVDLAGRPFLSYMIEWLGSHGVDEVVLACGFLPDQIREVLGEGEPGGPRLRYLVEPEPLGTAGAIRFAAQELDDRFLALNGDSLTDLDLGELVRFHERAAATATLGLYGVADPSAFGLVLHGPDGRVTEFLEKPEPGSREAAQIAADLEVAEVNAGIYVLERNLLDLIPAGRKVSIEREIFPGLVSKGLFARRLDGYWLDIGTPERYREATWDILEGRVKTGVKANPEGVLVQPGAEVAAEAEIGPRAVISAGCRIGAGTRITDSILHRDCMVEPGARITGSILSPGARVGAGVTVADAFAAPGERIEA